MGIRVECQTVIMCDDCDDTLIEALPRDMVIKMARRAGWAISKEVRCPHCRLRDKAKPLTNPVGFVDEH